MHELGDVIIYIIYYYELIEVWEGFEKVQIKILTEKARLCSIFEREGWANNRADRSVCQNCWREGDTQIKIWWPRAGEYNALCGSLPSQSKHLHPFRCN